MVGVETPSSLAVRFIERPLTDSSTAATFRASGLPRGGVPAACRVGACQRLAAWGRVGEVQTAAFAQIALLSAHQPVLDVSVTPTPLTAQPHDQSPWQSSSARKIGHLCRSQTLIKRAGFREHYPSGWVSIFADGVRWIHQAKP